MPDDRPKSGLSLPTLLIAAVASAIAAVVVPRIWQPGTVPAAAASPVIIALVSEALRRPVQTAQSVRGRRGQTRGQTVAEAPTRVRSGAASDPFDPLAPVPPEELDQLAVARAGAPIEPRGTRRGRPPQPRRLGLTPRTWKLGLATGLVAFLIAGAVLTVSELAIFGDSVTSTSHRTSLFGGSKQRATPTPTPSATPSATATPTATATASPTPTPTPTPTPSAPTPTPTLTPTPTPGLAPGTEAPAPPAPTATPAP